MLTCKICGKKIKGCNCLAGWKNIACGIEHYTLYMQQQEVMNGVKKLYKLRAESNGLTYDIINYTIGNDDVIFETGIVGKELKLSETDYIIVLDDEKKNILKEYEDNGEYVVVDKDSYAKIIKYSDGVKKVKVKKIEDVE